MLTNSARLGKAKQNGFKENIALMRNDFSAEAEPDVRASN